MTSSPLRRDRSPFSLAGLSVPAIAVAVLVAAAFVDQYFRDEFYYLACSHRLAWGYVDQPPLSIAILWLVRHVAGESLLVIRLASALALAATLLVTGSIARRLGGGRFAELLATTAAAIAPAILGAGNYYSMNVFDLLLWTLALRVLIDCLDTPRTAPWVWLGVLLGLGLLNKVRVMWLGAGIGAALILTPARRQLLTRGPYVAAAIAGVMFLPHILWQVANGWPTLEFIRNASRDKMQVNTPLSFLADQVMNLHPVTLPIWGGALVGLFVHPRLRRYRALAIVYLTVAAILVVNRTSRSGYLTAAYPVLFAAGGVLWESIARPRLVRVAMIAVVTILGLATAPLVVPILPTDTYVRYAAALGVAPSTEEKKALGRLPQHLADRQGWPEFVAQVAAVWNQVPPGDRRSAAILAGNYGEAGAIERLGAGHGLVAISGHNNYWLWGPQGRTGEVLIVLTRHPERLQKLFESVQLAGETDCGDCMPYENHLGIYVCRRMRPSLGESWAGLTHYD